MDVALEVCDHVFFDAIYSTLLPAPQIPFQDGHNYTGGPSWEYQPSTKLFSLQPKPIAYMSAWPRDHTARQFISSFLITWIFGLLAYYVFSTLSYLIVFDKKTCEHPKYLKNQIKLEMIQANVAMPVMAFLTAFFWMLEIRGYSKLYDLSSDGPGLWYDILQFPMFLLFTDFWIYWIHRVLHHPLIYKRLHKPHHKWIMPTPFASYAFHPMDGFLQSVPYHVFPLIFPLQKLVYLGMFIFINFWTILIHDGEYVANNPIINGAACHSIHHFAFNYNYGQYTTLWDRLGGSYRAPDEKVFNKQYKGSSEQWKKEAEEMEKIVREVEGEDDRSYGEDEKVESKKQR